LSIEGSDPNSGRFAALRQHYHRTRAEHRPVPVLLPLVVITALAVGAYFILDAHIGSMHDRWPDWIEKPSRFLTDIGRSWWVITLTVAAITAGNLVRRFSANPRWHDIARRGIHIASYVLASVAGAGLIANIFKRLIGRPRPVLFEEYGLFDFNPLMYASEYESFPSGHATVCGALFTALALLLPRFRWPLLLVGLYLAFTRVFVGAHYASDVLVGFGWGTWFAFLMAVMFARHGLVFSHKDGKLAKLT
jgi:membrane-associated phospholipid phosphatase